MSPFRFRALQAWAVIALCGACASSRDSQSSATPQTGHAQRAELREEYVLANDVSVRRLAPGVWLHTTLGGEEFGHYPGNGLIIEEGEGSVLVDAGWNPMHAEILLAWAEAELRRPVRGAVVTHFHSDRTGGIAPLLARGLPVHGLEETSKFAAAKGEPVPSVTFVGARTVGSLEFFFPGAGHSRDNIVVWHKESGVLFGGCFVKDAAVKNLGNIADAELSAWPASLDRTRERFPTARIVVPGHGAPGGPELLTYTQALLRGAATPR